MVYRFSSGCQGDFDSSGLGALQDSISYNIELFAENEDDVADAEFEVILGRYEAA